MNGLKQTFVIPFQKEDFCLSFHHMLNISFHHLACELLRVWGYNTEWIRLRPIWVFGFLTKHYPEAAWSIGTRMQGLVFPSEREKTLKQLPDHHVTPKQDDLTSLERIKKLNVKESALVVERVE